ncbi:hypothetical protein [Micromonospora aurantiaca (nom. illeg.)]|uniref:hypothetical protein n=1 Tax=Micromonospora aurantiaca (nom. illeg.) TaxID=47850 RepID=UPI0033C4AFAD
MNDSWGSQKTEPPTRRRCTEYGYLTLGAAALTADVLFCVIDLVTPVSFEKSVYSILTGLFVIGWGGWIIRSGDVQRRRHLAAAKAETIGAMGALAEKVDTLAEKVDRLPRGDSGGHRVVGSVHMSKVAQQEQTADLRRHPIDADTQPGQLRVVVRGGAVDEARAEGYAEGYVDGIARRQEGTSSPN